MNIQTHHVCYSRLPGCSPVTPCRLCFEAICENVLPQVAQAFGMTAPQSAHLKHVFEESYTRFHDHARHDSELTAGALDLRRMIVVSDPAAPNGQGFYGGRQEMFGVDAQAGYPYQMQPMQPEQPAAYGAPYHQPPAYLPPQAAPQYTPPSYGQMMQRPYAPPPQQQYAPPPPPQQPYAPPPQQYAPPPPVAAPPAAWPATAPAPRDIAWPQAAPQTAAPPPQAAPPQPSAPAVQQRWPTRAPSAAALVAAANRPVDVAPAPSSAALAAAANLDPQTLAVLAQIGEAAAQGRMPEIPPGFDIQAVMASLLPPGTRIEDLDVHEIVTAFVPPGADTSELVAMVTALVGGGQPVIDVQAEAYEESSPHAAALSQRAAMLAAMPTDETPDTPEMRAERRAERRQAERARLQAQEAPSPVAAPPAPAAPPAELSPDDFARAGAVLDTSNAETAPNGALKPTT